MSLSTALNIAQSSLLNTGRQTSVVSRNVQESNNPDYTRRMAMLGSLAPGSRVLEIQRATNEQLFRQNLAALSAWSSQHELYEGLERLEIAVHGIDNQQSAAAAIGKLQQALQTYSASPSDATVAEDAIDAARQVVRTLNAATYSIQSFRAEIDSQVAGATGELNQLLAAFKDANDAVVKGTRAGTDVSDALDRRDGLLKKIAQYVPVSTLSRPGNDLVLMTKDGVTLFETVPRSVTFQPTSSYTPGLPGNSIYIDGVPVGLGTGGNTDASGKLAGLVQLRDGVAPKLQGQMDEIARGLITAFAEESTTLPDAPGLFTWPGAPGMPPAGTLVNGLAGSIRLNAAFDYGAGGNPELLRDGGANGAAYVANTTGVAGYADLLIAYGDRIAAPMAFDIAAGLATTLSLSEFSTASVGWFQSIRKDASAAAQTKEALAARTEEALSNATGVNVDTEMALLLELERSYEASARLIKAIDEMLGALLAAVR
ncbi:flagellar hook-associated protein FlgK [Pseudaminobacter sp. 19-2017]|uniref:Flagellar hook-associated protein 1 n=1 Tax=Pseudaminobacter soli (ex Zhang et al. 2022) TaxID=2831468 RepID=A0A942E037_9HYPH|nr:flagellar hook-associated protein FlgK [Pseudaminobacter soli]MBS3650347.1 flagellar hook-associated protein FlgK [Pseudaminobacter soli]